MRRRVPFLLVFEATVGPGTPEALGAAAVGRSAGAGTMGPKLHRGLYPQGWVPSPPRDFFVQWQSGGRNSLSDVFATLKAAGWALHWRVCGAPDSRFHPASKIFNFYVNFFRLRVLRTRLRPFRLFRFPSQRCRSSPFFKFGK